MFVKNLILKIKQSFGRKTIIILLLIYTTTVILSLIAGYVYRSNSDECHYIYKFVNNALNCDFKHDIKKTNVAELRFRINNYIDQNKKEGKVDDVSVYFRDLHEGPTMGINDDHAYFSASLLKLPIVITFYKIKEEEAPDLNERIIDFRLTDEYKPMQQTYEPKKKATPGNKYTIKDLIYYSLVYSDNLSNAVLKSTLDQIDNNRKLGTKTLKELGLIVPESENIEDISTRGYASIFRILYNASYLNIADSEEILEMLTESSFDKGISAGVPNGVKVANKFGEKTDDENQLHDCGIVYYPENPYLICVMTEGKAFKDLEKVIADISRMVYGEMESRRIN